MTVIVTGGASGIGKAAAMRLAARSHVVIADFNAEEAARTVEEIRQSGYRSSAFRVDVSDRSSVDTMVKQVIRDHGRIEGLFSNAGMNLRGGVRDIDLDEWDRMIATHCDGFFHCAQNVIPHMRSHGGGAIVSTSSDFAVMGVAGIAAYCAAKTAIYSLTKSLAAEFAADGIRVNAIGPGPIDTALLRYNRSPADFAALEERNVRTVPMARLGQPAEVAIVVDFLLGERARRISGQIVHPNGGQLTW